MDDEEYEKLEDDRRANNFIVGDDDGYKDYGGEIWEVEDDLDQDTNNKKTNRGNKQIQNFFFNNQGDSKSKKKTLNNVPSVNKQSITNEESNAIMSDLLKKLDDNKEDEKGDLASKDNQFTGFNIYDQYDKKYDIAPPTVPKSAEEMAIETEQEQIQVDNSFPLNQENDCKENEGNISANNNVDMSVSISHEGDVEMADDNEPNNTESANISREDKKLPLPLNSDNTLSVFWIDGHEESINQSEVYLFGKVYNPTFKRYSSIWLVVRGINRIMYWVPKEEFEIKDVLSEISKMFDDRFKSIKKWKTKPVSKNYCFETPMKRGQSEVLEIRYSTEYQQLPSNLTGKTFHHIFGKNTSALELLIIQLKLMGPCWLTVKNPKINTQNKRSWWDYEIIVDVPSNIQCTIEDKNKPSPPLKVMSLGMKSCKNQKKVKEIYIISCITHEEVDWDKQVLSIDRKLKSFSLVRKFDNIPFPIQLEEEINTTKSFISKYTNEKALLEMFISKVATIDPDLIVAHGLWEGFFDTLMDRIEKNKVNMWSRIGRFKRNQVPKLNRKDGTSIGGFWMPRQWTIGRLIWDTYLSSRELIRETNYDLTELVKSQFGEIRDEFDPNLLPNLYKKSSDLVKTILHTEKDANFTIQLLFKLSIIPLTKQLTNIAGNLWYRSLQNARAERNEWLLLHEFNRNNFICPDKEFNKKPTKDQDEDKDEEEEEKHGKRKKAAYEGGLVLDPKPGLYDKIVLLLDFNSLYPSIIQEYNLCFTTVERWVTHDFDGREISDAKIDEVDVPVYDRKEGPAILPSILKMLVQARRAVKEQMKSEKDKGKLDQLEIKQKAIKLTANSMYGCLGFSSSRFYAKAIAALITRKGRDALKATYDITTNMLNYNVVYGDTDSIMVSTGSNNLKEAIQIGDQIKREVNKKYKNLEIELDGVFRSLLLLKKKKYAALVYTDLNDPNSFSKREIKGLDMVRRDWWPLSKTIGNQVLKEILSSKNQDEIQINLRAYFIEMAEKLKNQIKYFRKEFWVK